MSAFWTIFSCGTKCASKQSVDAYDDAPIRAPVKSGLSTKPKPVADVTHQERPRQAPAAQAAPAPQAPRSSGSAVSVERPAPKASTPPKVSAPAAAVSEEWTDGWGGDEWSATKGTKPTPASGAPVATTAVKLAVSDDTDDWDSVPAPQPSTPQSAAGSTAFGSVDSATAAAVTAGAAGGLSLARLSASAPRPVRRRSLDDLSDTIPSPAAKTTAQTPAAATAATPVDDMFSDLGLAPSIAQEAARDARAPAGAALEKLLSSAAATTTSPAAAQSTRARFTAEVPEEETAGAGWGGDADFE